MAASYIYHYHAFQHKDGTTVHIDGVVRTSSTISSDGAFARVRDEISKGFDDQSVTVTIASLTLLNPDKED